METRPYFLIGDLLANSVCGAAAAVAVNALGLPSWNMFLGMLVGMVVGMFVAMVGSFAFSPFFGAHEVMLPVMFTGMVAGMAVCMGGITSIGAQASWIDAAPVGAIVGIGIAILCNLWSAALRGSSKQWTS